MPSFFNLTLDTLAPAGVSLKINGGAAYTNSTSATLTIGTTDTPTTGYQMKIWGINNVASEAAASWETFTTTKAITLTTGDGAKTVNVKVRDALYNESAAVTATIQLNTSVPIVTITGPDVSSISEQTGKNVASFAFSVNEIFVEYKVKVVPTTNALENAGTIIPIAGGSTSMSGTSADGFPATTPINCTITGTDLKTASSSDGTKIIKVFVKDQAGNWSDA